MAWYIFLILLSALCTVTTQTIFKMRLSAAGMGLNLFTLKHVLTSPALLLGLVTYVAASFTWLKVLVSWRLSIAFPVWVALTFILNMYVASSFFGEDVSVFKIIGVFVIFTGIFIAVSY